eukprot:6491901-Amphidinium_carterae.1
MSEASQGDSSGNGLAEHAVREMKAKTRGLRLQVEEMHNVKLEQSDAIVVWMDQDGILAEFSEQVLWRDDSKKSRLEDTEDRGHRGVYLGPCSRTSDSLVGTTEGTVVKARSFRRLPETQKAAAEMVKSVPWRPDGDLEEEWTRLRVAVPDVLVPREQLPPAVVDDIAARHVYIRRNVELKKYLASLNGARGVMRPRVATQREEYCGPLGQAYLSPQRATGQLPTEEGVDAVMGDDVRAIDDAEALRVWSELSKLDPNLRGDTYVSEDGGQWHFSGLVDDLRVMRERKKTSREEEEREERKEKVPMEVSTTRKRAAETEADDSERTKKDKNLREAYVSPEGQQQLRILRMWRTCLPEE